MRYLCLLLVVACSVSGGIWITGNPKLPTCAARAFAERGQPKGGVQIEGNDDAATCP